MNKTPAATKYPNYWVDEGAISRADEHLNGRYGKDERGAHYQAISDVPYRSRPRVTDAEIDEVDAMEGSGGGYSGEDALHYADEERSIYRAMNKRPVSQALNFSGGGDALHYADDERSIYRAMNRRSAKP